jgi:large subunit ribosomal protein L24
MKGVKTGTVSSRIKRGDQVVFVAGKEYNRYDSAGKRQPFRGKVIAVDARSGKVKVEGAMVVKRHRKPVPQMNREGGIFEQEAWVDVSNVALIDPDTGNPTRVKYEIRDGEKVRVAKSGKVIPYNASYKREAKKQIDDEEDTTAKDAKETKEK